MIPRRKPRFYQGELKDIFELIFARKLLRGDSLEILEKKVAAYLGVKHVILACSGRNAMELIIDGMGLKAGDEIILPAYTLKDLILLIEKKGLVVKLADIEKDTFNIDPGLIEEKISPKTKLIIAVHLFGLPCDMERILKVADKYNIPVIEDCTHALGAQYKGRSVGPLSRAGFFSFEATKPVNAFGGGMVVTDDDILAGRIREAVNKYQFCAKSILSKIIIVYFERFLVATQLFSLVNLLFAFEFTKKILSSLYLSLNSGARAENTRFTNLQAYLAIRQLAELDIRNEARNVIAAELSKKISSSPSVIKANFTPGRIYYFYVIKVLSGKKLDDIRKQLLLLGVDTGIKQEITDDCSLITGAGGDYPVTKNTYVQALQLPIYDGLSRRQIEHIAAALTRVL